MRSTRTRLALRVTGVLCAQLTRGFTDQCVMKKRWDRWGWNPSTPTGATRVKLEEVRRQRKEATPAERRLWSLIRDRGVAGVKFRNRHIVEGLLLDFYAPSLRLAVELDGDVHDSQLEYDEVRTEALEALGICVIRFRNEEVFERVGSVLKRIRIAIRERRADLGGTAAK